MRALGMNLACNAPAPLTIVIRLCTAIHPSIAASPMACGARERPKELSYLQS